MNPLEGYLLDPNKIYWSEGEASRSSSIWSVGDDLFSTRFTQLINTFWLDSIANTAIIGAINDTYWPSTLGRPVSMDGYSLLKATATVTTSMEVIRCILPLRASIWYNEHANIPPQPSLDDSVDIARRLGKTGVLFGNDNVDEDIGYAALAVTGQDNVVTKLERRKLHV
ncbi:hypothetical protein CERZMDRAFT_89482 [Cercospora zeae-maydis SCOH1-5]|uniref:Uncharacterized protein n=1 Tax=Cercospora zeae-maydis SCOH1-5 TaxID=717836 RepID=A0A6A6EYK8_9PEZI|nr:hypothetical protein CERZMDRAFT_89482 [Cercospora zeae-maydis SCOH1-5]